MVQLEGLQAVAKSCTKAPVGSKHRYTPVQEEDGAAVAETLIKGSEEAVPQACEEDGSTPDRARYATTSEVFLQPRCIPNSEEEHLSVDGGSDSTQRSSSECVLMVDSLFRGTRTSVNDRVLCN
jgi:hypothetical protein